jgi:hypothetical protein
MNRHAPGDLGGNGDFRCARPIMIVALNNQQPVPWRFSTSRPVPSTKP